MIGLLEAFTVAVVITGVVLAITTVLLFFMWLGDKVAGMTGAMTAAVVMLVVALTLALSLVGVR